MNSINNNQLASLVPDNTVPPPSTPGTLAKKQLTSAELNEFCIKLADLIEKNGFILRYNHQLYMLYDGIYQPLDKSLFRHMIYQLALQHEVTLENTDCNYVLAEAEVRTSDFPYIPNNESHTLFRNGFVNNLTGMLEANVPNYFPTMRVEANYIINNNLYHPLTDQFLFTLADGDPVLIKLFWQVIGYCISSDANAKKIFVLYGESGDNGKSTFLSYLQSFITRDGVTSLSMSNLLGSRFALSELYMKRLELSTDEGTLNLGTAEIAVLKRISGHDIITADVKCQKQIQFLSTCKILIASNHNIGTAYSASDPAFTRRLCLIPFNAKIPYEKQDPFILQKLEMEKDAVATEAMRQYLELRQNSYQFAEVNVPNNPLSFVPNGVEYDYIRQFSYSYCNFSNQEAFTYTKELYQVFCNAFGNAIFKDITGFSQAFHRFNENKIKKTKKRIANDNCWGFFGVTFNKYYEEVHYV
ncbi:MAG: hypothetical protein IKL31_02795 [Ruminococcus sp.]|nr:hypothetical protein [Ruminococcus sp.]